MPAIMKFQRDWADEFYAYGFRIYESLELASEELEKIKKVTDFSFGTNEGWEDEEEGDIAESCSISEISQEEFNSLKRIFPNCATYGYGVVPYPES